MTNPRDWETQLTTPMNEAANLPSTKEELIESIYQKQNALFEQRKQTFDRERVQYRGTRMQIKWSESGEGKNMLRACQTDLARTLGLNVQSVCADGVDIHKSVNHLYRTEKGRKEVFEAFAKGPAVGSALIAWETNQKLNSIAQDARPQSDLASPEEARARRNRGRAL